MDDGDPFFIEEEGIIVVQSDCNDEFHSQHRSLTDDVILENSANLNSMHVRNFLKVDNYNDGTNLENQIIVQKLGDFIDDSHFNELSVIDTNPGQLEQFESDGRNITVVSRSLNTDVDSETVIISDLEDEEEVLISHFNDTGQFSEINSSENSKTAGNENLYLKILEGESNGVKQDREINIKKSQRKASIKSSSVPDFPQLAPKEPTNRRKSEKSIYIDKNDPRVRLHFVKFMKKDGKTIKIWECGICGKEFVHQYTLMRHLPIHTDERNYQCTECGKAFRQLSTLSQHKAIHTEHRPYACDICQKVFTRVSTLVSHKKIHTKEKPYTCPVCGKGFHQKGNMKNHRYIHSNVRPYKCDLCNRGFNQASNLQCHKVRAHNIENVTPVMVSNKFKCSLCDESFSRRSSLRQHEDYIHGIKSDFTSKNSHLDATADKTFVLKKKKIGNSRIIQLPMTNHHREKKMGLPIEPIDTKAMHKTLAAGAIPFALLKPAKGSPVVVKVQLCSSSKHMLVPASPAELRAAGKFSVICQKDGKKSVQIKVPVVATIHQRIDDKGEFHMDVEPPSDEEIRHKTEELETCSESKYCSQSTSPTVSAIVSSSVSSNSTALTQHFVLNSSIVKSNAVKDPVPTNNAEEIYLNVVNTPEDQVEYILPSEDVCSAIEMASQSESAEDLLAAAVNLASQSPVKDTLEVGSNEIQYLRPTANFGEYEVVNPDEATHFASSDCIIQKIKPIIAENVTMDQSHLSALMDALKNAGYELAELAETTDNDDDATRQIILNSVEDPVIVGNEIVGSDEEDDITSMPVDVDSEIVIKG